MRARAGLAIAATLLLSADGPAARADEERTRVACPWPVATLDVEAGSDVSLTLEWSVAGRTRRLPYVADTTHVFAWELAPGGAPPTEAEVRRLLGRLLPPGVLPAAQVWLGEDGAFGLAPHEGALPLVRDALADLTAISTLELRIVVQPSTRLPAMDAPPQRRETWPESEAAFDLFLAAETARWRAAREAGTAYAPSRPGMTLTPLRARPGEEPATFLLLEDWPTGLRLDGSLLASVSVGRGERGDPVVDLEIAPERQAAFEAFTTANVGQSLALVLDGEIVMAPTLLSPLRDRVQVTTGELEWGAAQHVAADLTSRLVRVGPARLELVAVLRPSHDGTRRLHVRLPAQGGLALRTTVVTRTQAWEIERAPAATPPIASVPDLLEAAQAVGLLGSAWGRALRETLPPADLAAILLARYRDAPHDDARADALELLGRLVPEQAGVAALLVWRAVEPSAPDRSAARVALGRPEARRVEVADALLELALARGASGPPLVRSLLGPLAGLAVPRRVPLLDDARPGARELGVMLLPGLREADPADLAARDVPRRLLRDPDPEVRGAGVWARLALGAHAPALTAPEALHLAAVLRNDAARLRGAALRALKPSEPGLRRPAPPTSRDPAADLLLAMLDPRGLEPPPGGLDFVRADEPALTRLLLWLLLERLTAAPLLPETEAWIALLASPEAEVRAQAVAAAAQRRALPHAMTKALTARRGDASAEVRALAALALAAQGLADEATAKEARAYPAVDPSSAWVPLWVELLGGSTR